MSSSLNRYSEVVAPTNHRWTIIHDAMAKWYDFKSGGLYTCTMTTMYFNGQAVHSIKV